MFRLIYRQRRRHLFAAFFGALALFCMFAGDANDMVNPDGPAWINTTSVALGCLIMGAGFACLSAVFVLVVPSCRTFVEIISLMAFLQVSLGPLLPVWIVQNEYEWVVWMALVFALVCTVYGTVLDRFRIWLDHSETRTFTVKGTAEDLWDWLVPGLDRNGGANWEPLLRKMEALQGTPNSFDVEYQVGHAMFEHQTITYEAVAHPHYARYHFQGELNPANKNLVQGTMAFSIEPVPGTETCRITLTRTRKSLLVREGLLMWFDDALGDQADHMRAKWTKRWDWSLAGKFRRHAVSLS